MRPALLLILIVLALPATAGAQANPFGPLPQPAAPEATPEPVEEPDDGTFGTGVLLLIGGAVLVSFIGIGWYITRDARAHLTEADRRSLALEREEVDGERVRNEAQAKKARARTKAQKQARKKQRARR